VPTEPAEPPVRIISLGAIEPRKNHSKLLQAFNSFCTEHPQSDVRLSLIGQDSPLVKQQIAKLVCDNPRVEFADFIPDTEVLERYCASHFTVFPSVEEGYGLPIAASLWFGKPCSCANFGSMAEIAAGGGCLAVDTRSVDELRRGLERLTLDRAFRQRLAHEAIARPLRSWRDYAVAILGLLDEGPDSPAVRTARSTRKLRQLSAFRPVPLYARIPTPSTIRDALLLRITSLGLRLRRTRVR
jgi:glycosyltransferase involved in cell wall biosynthesis